MTAIDRTASIRRAQRALKVLFLLAAALLVTIAATAPALAAGSASTGELLFFPCTDCHPVGPDGRSLNGKAIPNGFKGHDIVLQGHDKLGSGSDACVVCHDEPTKNPGVLKAIGGGTVQVDGNTSLVCAKCHSAKFAEFKAGTHGKHYPTCTYAGCHDPHTPGLIYASKTMPFTGTGFQFRVLSVREPLKPLMEPAPFGIPPVETPMWFIFVVFGGLVTAAVIATLIVRGRSAR